ncbi:hypothetical protein KC946_02615 [Candidatus Saccharibacteria bacterium]|nr:hypothetical protein [Candidatus Saccharibacteria bacterium]
MEHDRIDPLVEFDPCPLEYKESLELFTELDQYLEEKNHPLLTNMKKIGMIVIAGIVKAGSTIGLRPPPITEE